MRTLRTDPELTWTHAHARDDFIRTHSHTVVARQRRSSSRLVIPVEQIPTVDGEPPLPVTGGIMNEGISPRLSIDRNAVSAFCRRHHIRRLALFGSVLRDDVGPESDVDVLVECQAGHVPGLQFVSIERELSGLLDGRRVDMVTPKFLNPRIRDQVLGTAEPLYVAA